jgi:hypothetical protein
MFDDDVVIGVAMRRLVGMLDFGISKICCKFIRQQSGQKRMQTLIFKGSEGTWKRGDGGLI